MTRAAQLFIKEGYQVRAKDACIDRSPIKSAESNSLPDACALAVRIARSLKCTHVLDIGGFQTHRLNTVYPEFSVLGVEDGASLLDGALGPPSCQRLSVDLESHQTDLLSPETLKRTLILCTGVLERLADPSAVISTIKRYLQHAPAAIVTTPERDLLRGVSDMGPPADPAHVREWTLTEFRELLTSHGFDIAFHGLTCRGNSSLDKTTVLSVLHGAALPRRLAAGRTDFRVVAIMTAYNEEDIIYWSLRHLIDAGVEVYLIDNWSSDGTVAAAQPLLGRGLLHIERFPASGQNETFDLHSLLSRVEAVAASLDADWFIHHDADEVRESPWPEVSLKDALRYADAWGFNAVDHTVIDFPPIDNEFFVGTDFRRHFTHGCFGRRPGHFLQIKAWKNQNAPISLADSGGHCVDFPGRNVFPYKFLLRHYPVRSQQHGLRKVLLERKQRFSAKERESLGWHKHYDHVQGDHQFLRDPGSLEVSEKVDFYSVFLVERISGIGLVRDQTNGLTPSLPARDPESGRSLRLAHMLQRFRTLFLRRQQHPRRS